MRQNTVLICLSLFLAACGSTTPSSVPSMPATSRAVMTVEQDVSDLNLVVGQVVYVPAYSDIYTGGDGRTIDLAITLSVCNTDLDHPIVVTSIRYYNTDGELVRNYLDQPVRLAPMASSHVVVDPQDDTGGVGANFLVEWGAEAPVHEPVIEAVMINTASQQGLSFISPGRVLSETR